jgi:hypothetical protein
MTTIDDYGIYDYDQKMTNGLCDESVCTIVMVVVNAFYNYKYSHICNYISTFWHSVSWKENQNPSKFEN